MDPTIYEWFQAGVFIAVGLTGLVLSLALLLGILYGLMLIVVIPVLCIQERLDRRKKQSGKKDK
jgi:type IV secretory pathway TrbF-like protein